MFLQFVDSFYQANTRVQQKNTWGLYFQNVMTIAIKYNSIMMLD